MSEKEFRDWLQSIETPVALKISEPEEDTEEITESIDLDEARKRISGNLSVNTGEGSGGGFVSCEKGVQDYKRKWKREAQAKKLKALRVAKFPRTLTKDEAKDFAKDGGFPDKVFYHATVNKNSVLTLGLLNKIEVGTNIKGGIKHALGGGSDETVSLTGDLSVAKAISTSLKDVVDIANTETANQAFSVALDALKREGMTDIEIGGLITGSDDAPSLGGEQMEWIKLLKTRHDASTVERILHAHFNGKYVLEGVYADWTSVSESVGEKGSSNIDFHVDGGKLIHINSGKTIKGYDVIATKSFGGSYVHPTVVAGPHMENQLKKNGQWDFSKPKIVDKMGGHNAAFQLYREGRTYLDYKKRSFDPYFFLTDLKSFKGMNKDSIGVVKAVTKAKKVVREAGALDEFIFNPRDVRVIKDDVVERIEEGLRKIVGNLCVKFGIGSGGGFAPCDNGQDSLSAQGRHTDYSDGVVRGNKKRDEVIVNTRGGRVERVFSKAKESLKRKADVFHIASVFNTHLHDNGYQTNYSRSSIPKNVSEIVFTVMRSAKIKQGSFKKNGEDAVIKVGTVKIYHDKNGLIHLDARKTKREHTIKGEDAQDLVFDTVNREIHHLNTQRKRSHTDFIIERLMVESYYDHFISLVEAFSLRESLVYTGDFLTEIQSRWPKGSPGGKGGQFMSKLSAGAEAAYNGDFETVTPETFKAAVLRNKRSDTLTDYSLEDLSKMKLIMVKGFDIGVAVKKVDGGYEGVNLFNNEGERGIGAGPFVFLEAVRQGGTLGDHFDGYLTGFYKKLGFVTTRVEANWTEGGPNVNYIKWAGGDPVAAKEELIRFGRILPK